MSWCVYALSFNVLEWFTTYQEAARRYMMMSATKNIALKKNLNIFLPVYENEF